ncbi:hypothetical protein [Adlercreutzia mucosicola]|uniref:hypothetical protein n=1 Tax=Adlercreutzia mucosicola TaxID=580026 RepID=UPI002B250F08|nr:hypothetical protein [Adlercreutzia mucosicola]MEB1814761.1 hypothetical protein [Adlercreutzia mucosicola]
MLRDNLRKFREARGLSQQQLAMVCVLALAGGLAYLLGTQANRFAEGLEQGFQLQGTWKVPSDEGPFTTVSFGFTSADGGVWQIADFSRTAPLNGYFKATADPNLYLLHNEQHEEVGWANVAFTSAIGGKIDGLAYVQHGPTRYQVKRVDDFVTHYDRDFGGLTQTHLDDPARFREEAEGASNGEAAPDESSASDPVEGAAPSKVWLEEWLTK